MDEIQAWAPDDGSLDFIVDTEPKYQPYLRSLLGSPSLNEEWKPSATNTDLVPNPVSLNKLNLSAHRLHELGCTDNTHEERLDTRPLPNPSATLSPSGLGYSRCHLLDTRLWGACCSGCLQSPLVMQCRIC